LELEERFDKAEQKKFVKLVQLKMYKKEYGRRSQAALSPPTDYDTLNNEILKQFEKR
jgi:hypothetical protein